MKAQNQTLILAADNIGSDDNYNKQLVPIHGKPAIAWVIDSFKKNSDIFIVANKKNTQLLNYLENSYSDCNAIVVDPSDQIANFGSFSIVNSLLIGLDKVDDRSNLVVNFGDTLVKDIPDVENDTIIFSSDILSSERWTLGKLLKNRLSETIFDKKTNISLKDKEAFVGYFKFCYVCDLKKIASKAFQSKGTFFDIIKQYNIIHPFYCYSCNTWFDFGHKSGVTKAQNHFYNSREFNSLYTDPIRSIITKRSTNIQKLRDEWDWYRSLPNELQTLIPRILSFNDDIDTASLTMEMYGYPPLSELFIYGNLGIEEWELIVRRLFEVHKLFESYTSLLQIENYISLYKEKTSQRIEDLRQQNIIWEEILNYQSIIINRKNYKNINQLKDQLNKCLDQLILTAKVTIIHGDYCLSNILFDSKTLLCKLIDPRGRLKEKTIYGDPRYDIAKLRHSIVGGYDFIVHGLFKIQRNGNKFIYIQSNIEFKDKLEEVFNKTTQKFGYRQDEIELIEALLFLTMIPLHKDSLDRQMMFYVIAIIKLNQYFERYGTK